MKLDLETKIFVKICYLRRKQIEKIQLSFFSSSLIEIIDKEQRQAFYSIPFSIGILSLNLFHDPDLRKLYL